MGCFIVNGLSISNIVFIDQTIIYLAYLAYFQENKGKKWWKKIDFGRIRTHGHLGQN